MGRRKGSTGNFNERTWIYSHQEKTLDGQLRLWYRNIKTNKFRFFLTNNAPVII